MNIINQVPVFEIISLVFDFFNIHFHKFSLCLGSNLFLLLFSFSYINQWILKIKTYFKIGK